MFSHPSLARTSGNQLHSVLSIIAVLLALGAGILYAPAATATVKQMLHRAWPGSAKFTTAPRAPKTAKATAPRKLAAPAGNLNIARQGHAAIRLSDGKILVVGGENQNGLIRESEIFNPATHSFITAASLDTARTEHTLTPLANGRILVIGGRGQAQPLRTTEIYNYNGNVFTPGPSLNRPRAGHTATALSDGRVLIAGGNADGSAEIYNPATNTFTVVAGGLRVARAFHSAMQLNNGKVLLAGGKLANGNALNSAELFNPATQTFTIIAKPMRGSRVQPVLNKLRNGLVQVIGGGEETMEIFNTAGEYFTAYAHLPKNAATLKTPGRAAFYHRAARRAADSGDEAQTFARTEQTNDPYDRDGFTTTDTGSTNVTAGGEDSNGTTLNSSEESPASTATVTTDKSDYLPGETATITGSGFLPNQTVSLLIERDPPTPATTTWTAEADNQGNFTATYEVVATDSGVTFILTASQVGGPTAQTTFTDGLTINSFTVQNSTCTGGAITSANLNDTICANANVTVTGGSKYRIQWYNSTTISAGTLVYDDSGTGLTASATSTHPVNSAGTWTLLICATGNTGVCSIGNRSNITSINVGAATTTTTISGAGINPQPAITYNTNGSVTVSVSSGAGTPTGNVSLSVDGGTAVSKALSSGSATFTSTDIAALASPNAGNHSLSASYAAQGAFAASSATGTLAVSKASSTTTVTCSASTVIYTGSAQTPCTAMVTGAGGLNQSLTVSYANNTNAGTATASANFAGDANHTGSSDAKNFTIDKASSTTTISCPANVTYTGAALTPCSATATGAGSLSVAVAVTYGNNTNAGTATADAAYAGDSNHNGSTATQVGFTIDKASSTTTISCTSPVTYTGSALTPCTATATGAGGLSASVTVVYGNNTNAGTATADASYSGDANHNNSIATQQTFTIAPASSSTVVTCPASVTYNGAAQTPCSVAVTGAGGLSLTPAPTYTNNTNFGTATASYTFTGDANHTGSNDSRNFVINKAAVTATAGGGSATYDGATKTPSACVVTGAYTGDLTCANSPASVGPGAGTTTINPVVSGTGLSNFDITPVTGSYTISKAPSTTTVTCPTNVTYTGLALTPCSATVTGAGGLNQSVTVVYGNNTNAGTATASASYVGDANHEGSSDSKNFTIDPAASVTTVSCPASVTYNGSAQTPCTATATGAGGLNQSLTVSYTNNTDAGTATANASFGGDANHTGSNGSATFTINKAVATVTVSGYTGNYDAAAHGATAVITGVDAGGAATGSSFASSSFTNVPGGTANWTFTGGTNYTDQSGTAVIVINKAVATVTVTGYTGTYDATAHGATAVITGVDAGGAATGSSFSSSSFTDYPGGTANWTFTGGTNYTDQSGTAAIVINKATATCTINGYTGIYDATAHGASGSCVGVAGDLSAAGSSLNLGANFTDYPGGTANWSFTGGTNYTNQSGTAAIVINKAMATVTVNGYTGVYDAAPHGASGSATGVGGANLNAGLSLGATFTNAPGGTANWTFTGGTNYTNQSGSAAILITPAPTTTTVNTPVPSVVQYSDLVTLSATVTVNNGYGATLAGAVQFKINGVNRGAPVPLPAGTSASRAVSLTLVVTEAPNTPPNTYPVTAVFTPSIGNYLGSTSASVPLKVQPENANPISFNGAYTGQLSAWTPTSTSNTATLTLAATIKDTSVDDVMDPYYGDITKAKITFALRNSTGGLTPITGATNLPVGLVNAGVSGIGTAAAIVQFSLSSSEVCANYTVVVQVGGNYSMATPTWQDEQISVCRATPGSMVAAPPAEVNATGAAGFIAGSSTVQFDVKYNKSATNPQGKVKATIISNLNAATGLVDGKTHTYVITTNSIASLSVKGLTANFAAKANVVELITNPDNTVTAVNLDGNCTLQLAVTDSNSTTTKDTLALTVNKSTGGLWFSSNWVTNKSVEKAITSGDIKITP